MVRTLILLAVAGALGTLARYGLSTSIARATGEAFPWGTLVVNVIGCFLFGLVFHLAEERRLLTPELRLVLLTGFLGGFTTFSAFAHEGATLIGEARHGAFLAQSLGQTALGVAAVYLGYLAARFV